MFFKVQIAVFAIIITLTQNVKGFAKCTTDEAPQMEGVCSTRTIALDKQCYNRNSNSDYMEFRPTPPLKQMTIDFSCKPERLSCFRLSIFYDEKNTSRSDCSVSEGLRKINCTFSSCNRAITFTNLQPGNYCVMMTEYDNKMGCRHDETYTEMHNLQNVAYSVSTSSVTTDYNYFKENQILIILLCLGSVLLMAIFVFVILYRRKVKRQNAQQKEYNIVEKPTVTLSKGIFSTSPIRVCILYSRDCEHHQTVVDNLANFFQLNNCQVSYNIWEIHQIVTNKVAWISEKLNGNYKLILIASRKSVHKQKAWLQNKSGTEDELSDDQLFLQAIATIMYRTDQAFDYSKLFVVRPSYVPSDCVFCDICPGRMYSLPQNLATLMCHLHGIDTRNVDVEDNSVTQWGHCFPAYRKLVSSIDNLAYENVNCTHCTGKNSQEIIS